MKCGVKLLFHSQTSTLAQFKLGNGYVISYHTYLTCNYLPMMVWIESHLDLLYPILPYTLNYLPRYIYYLLWNVIAHEGLLCRLWINQPKIATKNEHNMLYKSSFTDTEYECFRQNLILSRDIGLLSYNANDAIGVARAILCNVISVDPKFAWIGNWFFPCNCGFRIEIRPTKRHIWWLSSNENLTAVQI